MSKSALCYLASTSFAITLLLHPQVAWAQVASDEPVQDKASPSGIEDIVVTATRREARLQQVPVAVTALAGEALLSTGVLTVQNLTQVVPGFIGSRNMGLFQPVIRGVGSTGISIGDESNIATYIDGVYQPESVANWIDLVEVERVEVLRGPQGTTFGRNATGGLINVITPDPSFDFRGKAALRAGRMGPDAGDYDARLYVTGPLSNNVALDVAGLFRRNDGYIEDLVRGGTLGDQRVINLRSKLLFQPVDNFKIVFTGEFFDQKSTTNSPQPIDGNTAGRRFPGVILPTDAWQASLTEIPRLDTRRWTGALHMTLELDGINIESTSGFLSMRFFQNTDSDASNLELGNFAAIFRSESVSQEIKLSSSNPGPLQWLVGGYFYQFGGNAFLQPWTAANPSLPLAGPTLEPELGGRSFAGFADATYEVATGLFMNIGGRYTTETREFSQTVNGNLIVNNVDRTFNNFNYKIGVRYELDDKTNAYASWSTAFKSGVYNMASTRSVPVEPEEIQAAEFGIKSDPLSWLRANLAVYYYDYRNLQLQSRDQFGPGYILQNAANAEIYGGELETTIVPTSNLSLRAALAYTKARYKDFPLAQGFFPRPDGGNTVSPFDASGNVMTRAPEWSGNVGFDWGQGLGGGRIAINGNVFFSSRLYGDFANNFSQGPYSLTNMSISWKPDSERWNIGLWAINLTNERVLQTIRPGALSTDGFYEPPRRIGANFEVFF
ncbi:MAG: Pesticin receptor [Chloroflexi bacterium]|nr:Pesticin receptor [Chloroflexota bacterium]